METLRCEQCGASIQRRSRKGPAPRFCSSCARARTRASNAQRARERTPIASGLIQCGHCQRRLPVTAFNSSQRHHGSWCRECLRTEYVKAAGGLELRTCERCGDAFEVTARSRQRFCGRDCKDRAKNERAHTAVLAAKAARTCEGCGKPIPDMRSNARWCSNSCALKNRSTPEQRAKWKLADRLRKYGLTVEEYEAFMAVGCAICGTHESQDGRAMSIDHCHVSGKPRGVLCGHCNKGLGLFLDRPDLLRKAAIYLEGAAA